MSLAENLRAGPPTKQPGLCKIGRELTKLDDDDRAAFDEVAAVPNVDRSWLRRRLVEDAGLDVSRTTLGTHLNGECCCHG